MKYAGIKKAVGDFNHWTGTARIYVDCKSGEIWCDTEVSYGNYSVYWDKAIHMILDKGRSMHEHANKTSMSEVAELAEREIKAYRAEVA